MILSKEKYISAVALALDEVCYEDLGGVFAGDERDLLRAMILSVSEESAIKTILNAKADDLFMEALPLMNTPQIAADGKGFIDLPSDFVRIVAFRMSDWSKTLLTPLHLSDNSYDLLLHGAEGICGNAQNPKMGVSVNDKGRILEFASCRLPNPYVEIGLYMPVPMFDASDNITMPTRCVRAFIYASAANVALTTADVTRAQQLDRLFEQSLL